MSEHINPKRVRSGNTDKIQPDEVEVNYNANRRYVKLLEEQSLRLDLTKLVGLMAGSGEESVLSGYMWIQSMVEPPSKKPGGVDPTKGIVTVLTKSGLQIPVGKIDAAKRGSGSIGSGSLITLEHHYGIPLYSIWQELKRTILQDQEIQALMRNK